MKKQLNTFLNIHMMGYYAAIKKNKATIKQTDMEQSLRYTGKKKKSKIQNSNYSMLPLCKKQTSI